MNLERLLGGGEFRGCLVEALIGARGAEPRPGNHRPGGGARPPQDSADVSVACKPDSRRDSAASGGCLSEACAEWLCTSDLKGISKAPPLTHAPPRPASAHSSLHSFHT